MLEKAFICRRMMHSFRLRVSGLPRDASRDSVTALFSSFNPSGYHALQTEAGKNVGHAVVSFPSVEIALEAQSAVNGTFYQGSSPKSSPRRLSVVCDFRGPRIVRDASLPREPNPRRLIKLVRDKAVGARWPNDPVMASTNESRMLRRYKTGGLPRAHDRQR
jgi:hypothetical protein